MIIGGTFLGVTWIFKGMIRESLIEFAKLVWDKERMKDEAINRVLTLEANKHHGKEVDPDKEIPKPDEVPSRSWMETQFKYIAMLNEETHKRMDNMNARINILEDYHDLNVEDEYVETESTVDNPSEVPKTNKKGSKTNSKPIKDLINKR